MLTSSSSTPQEEEQTRQPLTRIDCDRFSGPSRGFPDPENQNARPFPSPPPPAPELADPEHDSGRQCLPCPSPPQDRGWGKHRVVEGCKGLRTQTQQFTLPLCSSVGFRSGPGGSGFEARIRQCRSFTGSGRRFVGGCGRRSMVARSAAAVLGRGSEGR